MRCEGEYCLTAPKGPQEEQIMTAVRKTGKVNDNTCLIDIGMMGVAGVTAVYLIEDEKTCLIDGGTKGEASRIINFLKAQDAFPPDIIIVTHSHWDHTQGIPRIRKEAARLGKTLEIVASEKAIPLLGDQSYNTVFEAKTYENIVDVTPVKEGDVIDIGRTTLRVFEAPGHNKDHIAILDETNKNVFVGDSIGYKVGDDTFLPPFMPPFWDRESFQTTIEKYKQLNFESLCLAHFGFIYGDEARSILDEAVTTCDTWWQLFERNADKLDDADHLMEAIFREISPAPINPEIVSLKLRILAGLMTAGTRLFGKEPKPLFEYLLKGIIAWLAKGYNMPQEQTA